MATSEQRGLRSLADLLLGLGLPPGIGQWDTLRFQTAALRARPGAEQGGVLRVPALQSPSKFSDPLLDVQVMRA